VGGSVVGWADVDDEDLLESDSVRDDVSDGEMEPDRSDSADGRSNRFVLSTESGFLRILKLFRRSPLSFTTLSLVSTFSTFPSPDNFLFTTGIGPASS
jgi:hypothetical protein